MSLRWGPDRILRRLPAYGINGITVAVGIGVVHLLFGVTGGLQAAQIAGSAAVCASLADLPTTVGRTAQRVLGAAALSACAALVVALLAAQPVALGFAVMATAFVAMLTMAWGPRAGPISFAPILALVFSMAVLHEDLPTLAFAGWTAGGALAYLGWAVATSALLQRRYRRLALVAALRAAAELLRARAGLLAPAARGHDPAPMARWIADEAALAERLQAARDLVFSATDAAKARRGTAMLLHAIDLRDVLLASRLDLDLLGDDRVARQVLDRLANALRSIARALDDIATAMRDRVAPADALDLERDPATRFGDVDMPEGDPRDRALLLIGRRLRHITDNVAAVDGLARGADEDLPLSRSQLQRFIVPEAWPWDALARNFRLGSPVLRHAVRMSLALGVAYFVAALLPWASHPHWLVLSVAVVLRGNLEQTLTRRNARVLGTLFGCLVVVGLGRWSAPGFVEFVFLVSVGLAHSFVNVRYWVTATAATVMALLQSRLADPSVGFAIGERLADTVLGAGLGWAFSYVLPSWERANLPQALDRALAALETYAQRVLAEGEGDAVEQRLARRNAYDALGAVAAAAQRSLVEPKSARLPFAELTTFLDHGQRLMADLSSVRLMRARETATLQQVEVRVALDGARTALSQCLLPTGAPQADVAERSVLAGELPEDLPATDALPWLQRRLAVAVQDGRRVRLAADAALAGLA